MSIVENLVSSGTLDESGARLLYDTVKKVAHSRRHPPPEGFRGWSGDAVITAAHGFLTGHRADARLVQLALQATDDASFARLLETAILNYLRDEARRTTLGAQIRRLKDVVKHADDVVLDSDRLRLADGPDAPFGDDEAKLVQAAMAIDVTRRRQRPDAKRRGPVASSEDMLTLVRAVLTAAGGSITLSTMARVIARRFDLDVLPVTVAVDALDPRALSSYDDVDVQDQASVILDQLTDRERAILPLLDLSSREVAPLVGLGHSTVAKTQARLRSLLAQLLPPGGAGSDLLRVLTERLESEGGRRVDS